MITRRAYHPGVPPKRSRRDDRGEGESQSKACLVLKKVPLGLAAPRKVEMDEAKVSMPGGLRPRGAQFWRRTVDRYSMTNSELEILHEACKTMDNLDDLAAMVAADGPKVTSGTGRIQVHPALMASASLRATLHRLLCALGLPDQDGQLLGSAQKTRARTAATARWRDRRA